MTVGIPVRVSMCSNDSMVWESRIPCPATIRGRRAVVSLSITSDIVYGERECAVYVGGG